MEELGILTAASSRAVEIPLALKQARTGLMRVSSVVPTTCSINHCCQRSGSEAAGIEIEGRDAVSNGGARFIPGESKLCAGVRACVSFSTCPCSLVARNWGLAGYAGWAYEVMWRLFSLKCSQPSEPPSLAPPAFVHPACIITSFGNRPWFQ